MVSQNGSGKKITKEDKRNMDYGKLLARSLRVFFKDALQSEFLRTIRQNHEQLHETDGGCALWVKREWVQSLLQ